MTDQESEVKERRRSARFSCGGVARLSCLPSDGVVVSGALRDLSFGGCRIDSDLPLRIGMHTEILVRVNTVSFRVVGEVKVERGKAGAGIEFVHLNGAGKETLAHLIAELAKSQAVINRVRSSRRETDEASFRREFEDRDFQSALLSRRFPVLGSIMGADGPQAGDGEVDAGQGLKRATVETPRLVIPVDLFG